MQIIPLSPKVEATLNSRNFFISLLSVLLMAIELNGFNVSTDAGQIYDAIDAGQVSTIVSIFFVNFLNPILKLASKTASWSWGFLKSPNFLTQVATVLLVGLAGLGIAFPDGAAAAVVDSIFQGGFQTIVVALVINILNPLYHFFFDRETPGGGEKIEAAPSPKLAAR